MTDDISLDGDQVVQTITTDLSDYIAQQKQELEMVNEQIAMVQRQLAESQQRQSDILLKLENLLS